MAEVLWSLTAADDLRELADFIAHDSILHAIHFINRIVEACERLGQAPLLGRVLPELDRTNLRELLFRGYQIVYLVQDERVTILRVVHGARDVADQVEENLGR
jgi:plasmid stabilization system protein ParE